MAGAARENQILRNLITECNTNEPTVRDKDENEAAEAAMSRRVLRTDRCGTEPRVSIYMKNHNQRNLLAAELSPMSSAGVPCNARAGDHTRGTGLVAA
jgi:hypothetical protein